MLIDGRSAGAAPIWGRAGSWRGVAAARRDVPRPGAETTAAPAGATRRRTGWTLRRAMRTPHFWLLVAGLRVHRPGQLPGGAASAGVRRRSSASTSSTRPRCLGMGAFLSLPGVIITGTLSDYIGRELSAVVTYGTSIFGVACAMLITSPDQHLLLWLHSCFFGLTWGARGPAITAKTADLFPGPQLGTILGVITIGTGIGSATGSWLAGYVFDVTGRYQVAFGFRSSSICAEVSRSGRCGGRRRGGEMPRSIRRPSDFGTTSTGPVRRGARFVHDGRFVSPSITMNIFRPSNVRQNADSRYALVDSLEHAI